jgi:hypothetical protein
VKEIQNLELSDLMDMLSEHTAIYTRLMADGNRTEEFDNAMKKIKLLQAEIQFRKTTLDVKSELASDKNRQAEN